MTVKVLICRPDGTADVETREFPEGWLDAEKTEK